MASLVPERLALLSKEGQPSQVEIVRSGGVEPPILACSSSGTPLQDLAPLGEKVDWLCGYSAFVARLLGSRSVRGPAPWDLAPPPRAAARSRRAARSNSLLPSPTSSRFIIECLQPSEFCAKPFLTPSSMPNKSKWSGSDYYAI